MTTIRPQDCSRQLLNLSLTRAREREMSALQGKEPLNDGEQTKESKKKREERNLTAIYCQISLLCLFTCSSCCKCSGFILSRADHYRRLLPRSTRPPPTVGRRQGSCRAASPQVSPGRPWCRGHCRPSCPGPARASSSSELDETGNPPRRSWSTRSSCSPPI